MAPNQRSPKRETSKEEDNEKDERKRVGKACDRCRLKKSKVAMIHPRMVGIKMTDNSILV